MPAMMAEANGVRAGQTRRDPPNGGGSRSSLAPHEPGRAHDQLELVPLVVHAERVPHDRRRESALRAEREALEPDQTGRLPDAGLELLLRLPARRLRGHEPEHHQLVVGHEAQRVEAARALVVVLE
jgi:hypothetical protein